MIASTRARRAEIRRLTRTLRAHHRATRHVAAGTPQTARTHLLAAGIDVDTAARYAGAWSRGVLPAGRVTVTIRPHQGSRRPLRVEAKTFSAATAAARTATYRPRDTHAAIAFDRALAA